MVQRYKGTSGDAAAAPTQYAYKIYNGTREYHAKESSRCFSCSTLAQAATSSWKAFQWDARLNGPISVDSMLGTAADHS